MSCHWSLFLSVQLTITQHWFRYGLSPNWWRSIIWTNADPINWHIYAALWRRWVNISMINILSLNTGRVNTEAETKWSPYRRWQLQVHFLEWKLLNFKWNFTKISSLWSNWQYGSIGSDNGLAPNRRQAIIWTNVGTFYWRIYASLGLNELMFINSTIPTPCSVQKVKIHAIM